jgi:glycosyltransferase involved in cell wall biosynthesis
MGTLEVAIFSYNRGKYLRNCIESIYRNMLNVNFKVYDDGSTDPETISYLQSLGPHVIFSDNKISDRHGGYYQNMQLAISNSDANFLLLLQDDMQLVRKFQPDDLADIKDIFERFPCSSFISPVFLKGRKRKFFNDHYRVVQSVKAYIWDEKCDAPVPGCYADVSIVHLERLRTSQWIFQTSEDSNAVLAKEKYGRMPQLSNPFAFYLPEEPAYRSKELTLGAKLALKMNGGEIMNFLDMNKEDSAIFVNRDINVLPYAEDFIQTTDPKVKKPYKFNGYRKSWLTMCLNKVELIVRRLI